MQRSTKCSRKETSRQQPPWGGEHGGTPGSGYAWTSRPHLPSSGRLCTVAATLASAHPPGHPFAVTLPRPAHCRPAVTFRAPRPPPSHSRHRLRVQRTRFDLCPAGCARLALGAARIFPPAHVSGSSPFPQPPHVTKPILFVIPSVFSQFRSPLPDASACDSRQSFPLAWVKSGSPPSEVIASVSPPAFVCYLYRFRPM